VLAAGAGSRFGGGKLMAPWLGGRLIDGALTAAFAAPVRRVIVVAGADPGVGDAATAFAAGHPHGERLRIVWAADHAEGMSASLRAGVGAVTEGCAGAFVFLGDMPLIPPGLADMLASRLTAGVLAVAPAFEGRRGHPVLFSAPLLPALGHAAGDEGARAVLAGLGERLVLLPTDSPGVLLDVDRPGDLPPG
jgi:molybdenum cofactor cytidylyltransferase